MVMKFEVLPNEILIQCFEYEPYLLNTSGFPLVQLLIYVFYFVPYYCAGIIALFFYHQQLSQFSYLCSSLHNPPLFPDASWSPISNDYWSITVTKLKIDAVKKLRIH